MHPAAGQNQQGHRRDDHRCTDQSTVYCEVCQKRIQSNPPLSRDPTITSETTLVIVPGVFQEKIGNR